MLINHGTQGGKRGRGDFSQNLSNPSCPSAGSARSQRNKLPYYQSKAKSLGKSHAGDLWPLPLRRQPRAAASPDLIYLQFGTVPKMGPKQAACKVASQKGRWMNAPRYVKVGSWFCGLPAFSYESFPCLSLVAFSPAFRP